MRSLDIITSSTSLVYLSTLSDNKIIPNISPTLRPCMIEVDTSNKRRIISVLFEWFSRMMDDYSIYWPIELVPILIALERECRRCIWIWCEYSIVLHFWLNSSWLFSLRFFYNKRFLSSSNPLLFLLFYLIFGYISDRFIRTPFRSRYYLSIRCCMGDKWSWNKNKGFSDTFLKWRHERNLGSWRNFSW